MLIYLQMIETPEERSKFEQIYLEYKNIMFHVAFKILNNEQDAEDAVHQAFVKIAENIKKIGEPRCPKSRSYIVIIVERTAIDLYHRNKNHSTVELNEELAGIAVPYEGDNTLTRCILNLPARYREMILLRYRHGYSVREVSNMLGISLPAAIKLDQRAKAKLRESCKQEGLL